MMSVSFLNSKKRLGKILEMMVTANETPFFSKPGRVARIIAVVKQATSLFGLLRSEYSILLPVVIALAATVSFIPQPFFPALKPQIGGILLTVFVPLFSVSAVHALLNRDPKIRIPLDLNTEDQKALKSLFTTHRHRVKIYIERDSLYFNTIFLSLKYRGQEFFWRIKTNVPSEKLTTIVPKIKRALHKHQDNKTIAYYLS
jgi:hypothetical protein